MLLMDLAAAEAARAGESGADMTQLAQQHAQPLWQLADVATAAGDATAAVADAAVKTDWLTPVADALERVLTQIDRGLEAIHVPYSYGWSIIALTALVKLATWPFTKIQVESSINTQALKPQTDLIKRRYGEDKERIQRETSALYEKAGVNPLAGCLPTLATIPVFWGLFRTLTNVSASGQLSGGFYFIPSLSGPTSVAARASGAGISWLWPLTAANEPPIGWDQASRYLVLPVLLVIAQFISTAIITPPKTEEEKKDENPTVKLLVKALPLMIGWFSLNLPSGLGLYYLSNTVLSTGQQVWLRRGAGDKQFNLGPINVGQARHTGPLAGPIEPFEVDMKLPPGATTATSSLAGTASPESSAPTATAAADAASSAAGDAAGTPAADAAAPTQLAASSDATAALPAGVSSAASTAMVAPAAMPAVVNRRCKRSREPPKPWDVEDDTEQDTEEASQQSPEVVTA